MILVILIFAGEGGTSPSDLIQPSPYDDLQSVDNVTPHPTPPHKGNSGLIKIADHPSELKSLESSPMFI